MKTFNNIIMDNGQRNVYRDLSIEDILLQLMVEENENKLKVKHNEVESKKIFCKKEYLSYDNSKFLQLINYITNLSK